MKKIIMPIVILAIIICIVGCKKKEKVYFVDYFNKIMDVQLPNCLTEQYWYHTSTFTGRADHYAVLLCDDQSIIKLRSEYDFKRSDEESSSKLNSILEKLSKNTNPIIDESYLFDVSQNYLYYKIDGVVWLILTEEENELIVFIIGY